MSLFPLFLVQIGHYVPSLLAPHLQSAEAEGSSKKTSLTKLTEDQEEGSGEGEGPKKEVCVYEEAKSFVFLEIKLHRPLISKRPPSALAQRYACMYGWMDGCMHTPLIFLLLDG